MRHNTYVNWALSSALFLASVHCGGTEDASSSMQLEPEEFYASELVSYDPGPGAGFGQDQLPNIVLGPPDGRGPDAGGLDVLSLGQGGSIVLGFGDSTIVDGPGADFIVFENPFWISGDSDNVFAELGRVEVSEDGEIWSEFPCNTDTREGCAGWRPPLPYDPELVLPPDLTVCGGDGFDLADIGVAAARFVRVTDLGENAASPSAGFDLDAIAIIHQSSTN